VTDGALVDGSAVSVEELARPDRVANVEKNQALIGDSLSVEAGDAATPGPPLLGAALSDAGREGDEPLTSFRYQQR